MASSTVIYPRGSCIEFGLLVSPNEVGVEASETLYEIDQSFKEILLVLEADTAVGVLRCFTS